MAYKQFTKKLLKEYLIKLNEKGLTFNRQHVEGAGMIRLKALSDCRSIAYFVELEKLNECCILRFLSYDIESGSLLTSKIEYFSNSKKSRDLLESFINSLQ